jgi:hypothetical protein
MARREQAGWGQHGQRHGESHDLLELLHQIASLGDFVDVATDLTAWIQVPQLLGIVSVFKLRLCLANWIYEVK